MSAIPPVTGRRVRALLAPPDASGLLVPHDPRAGSALLLVVAATSSLALVAAVLLLLATTAYGLVAARADGLQARLLAEAGLRDVGRALGDGRLPVPDPDTVDPELWQATWRPGAPPVAPGFETPSWGWSQEPPAGGTGDAVLAAGIRVEVRFVLGPDGTVREAAAGTVALPDSSGSEAPDGSGVEAGSDDFPLLVEATSSSWFRRGRAVRRGRFAVR